MKSKNFDYQSIKPFEKAKPNAKFDPNRCFKYYVKQTHGNDAYALEKTFKYIDGYYEKYKKNNKINAHEKYIYKDELINRLSELVYESQVSFSVMYSIVISIAITLFFAALQMPNSSGNNFFEIINNGAKEFNILMENFPVFAATFTKLIYYILLGALLIFIMSFPVVNSIIWIREKYESTKFDNNFLKPYEREVVLKILSSYEKDYGFLK